MSSEDMGSEAAWMPSDYVLQVLGSASDDALRLFHGRGGVYPEWKHISVDWYSPAVFITLYEDRENSEGFILKLSEKLKSEGTVKALAIQRRYEDKSPVEILWGELPERASESGLSYMLSLSENQNHGFFLDMEPGRTWLSEVSEGKSVLNLFAYTCALSVAAIKGGAERVVNLDQSSRSLSIGRENHRLNFDQAGCRRVSYLSHDLFKSWGRLKRLGPFDIIILDPPSHQPGSFVVEKDYPRMVRRVIELINRSENKEAYILACLNAPELDESYVSELFEKHAPEAELIKKLPDPQGYVESGEGAGLKRLVYRF